MPLPTTASSLLGGSGGGSSPGKRRSIRPAGSAESPKGSGVTRVRLLDMTLLSPKLDRKLKVLQVGRRVFDADQRTSATTTTQ
jgi:hypothetical protein